MEGWVPTLSFDSRGWRHGRTCEAAECLKAQRRRFGQTTSEIMMITMVIATIVAVVYKQKHGLSRQLI